MSGFGTTVKREACFFAGAATTAFFFLAGADLLQPSAGFLVQMICFLWLFGVMLWCAFGVVRHADCLAAILGEPYGTLILTLSVIGIEVSLIVSIMLTGGTNEPLARDTMLAVLHIVLNGMVGVSLLLGGLKYGEQPFNTQGARSFLSVLIPLVTISLILPRYTTSTADPSLSTGQQISFAVMIGLLYLIFLATQSIRHRSFFIQPKAHSGVALSFLMAKDEADDDQSTHDDDDHDLEIFSTGYHATFLILTMLPIVLLSKKFAVLVDYGISSFHMPVAVTGVLVALLVLTPEGLGSFRAALSNRLQRSVNICLGSALATIGLTVPAVLIAAGIFDIHIVLGVKDTDMILLLLTLILSVITFTGTRTNALQGAVHLVLFIFYFILLFQP
ncbi:calcium:proton antiporter [Pseudovibrio japonicus]|uniref:Calcium:proton antiporter n=1 Tax=Pseudovibrio japonicus TaxID=366534 RepID=A0ABQ3DYX2_9HYPH|nr:calcium:proton antiporter [Pseudovibrio japonicus]